MPEESGAGKAGGTYMRVLEQLIHTAHDLVWGPAMIAAFLGAGLWFTCGSRFFQVRRFGLWQRRTFCTLFHRGQGAAGGRNISQLQAMTTALAASLGTGNIVGVAGALILGGPGAIFWMWVSTFLGMMTSFAENALGVQYRTRRADGSYSGGPMGYMERGLGFRWMAVLFAVFCVLASFGIGNMTQGNSAATALQSQFGLPPVVCGIVFAGLFAAVSAGGITRIAKVTEKLIPFLAIGYLAAGAAVILYHHSRIVPALAEIVSGAFDWRSAAGGFFGSAMMRALRCGTARGVFSNEAGMGSAVFAHCAAENGNAAEQGMWGMFEVFTDTIVMCTVTALVILTSGVPFDSATDAAALSTQAFSGLFGRAGGILVAAGVTLFAFATLTGWSYFGEQSTIYLFGERAVKPYRILFIALVFVGCVTKPSLAWELSDLFNGLMAVPNLIAVLSLSGEVFRILRRYLTPAGEYEIIRPKR